MTKDGSTKLQIIPGHTYWSNYCCDNSGIYRYSIIGLVIYQPINIRRLFHADKISEGPEKAQLADIQELPPTMSQVHQCDVL